MALASKCRALILSSNMKKQTPKEDSSNANVEESGAYDDVFHATFKELSKWENLEKSDTNWELVVHKNNLTKR